MSAEAFLDTNVFIYQLEASDERKAAIADRLIGEAVETGSGCISFQVAQECLNTVLRKAEIPLDIAGARRYFDAVLEPLLRVTATSALYHRALDINARYAFHFYDALIVAAALDAGCRRLYTEDLQHGQRVESLTVTNPFA